jgi:hypothetical protein
MPLTRGRARVPSALVDSFDQSLKYLLHEEPADFARFALGDKKLQVLGPVESGLPSRGRDVDGAYFVKSRGDKLITHFEFYRRHESERELAVDVGEAQIRLYRREGVEVVSIVWDLYGRADEPATDERTFAYSPKVKKRRSQVVYLRVNLRALGWKELLAKAPPPSGRSWRSPGTARPKRPCAPPTTRSWPGRT